MILRRNKIRFANTSIFAKTVKNLLTYYFLCFMIKYHKPRRNISEKRFYYKQPKKNV